ncbi:MAG: PQQ-binding-like beta-propeller repeat protein [Gemmataceae bacterium]|nr:PQQ-binding-like beta-propeller repeat protein [Gemmataceae bacterium]
MWFPLSLGRRSTSRRPTRRKPPSVRPTLELLEDRTVPSGVNVVSADPNDWPMYNHDSAGSRHNHAEHRLSPATVGNLGVKWTYETPGAIAGTPAVVNDRVYAADATGLVHALDRDGHLLWQKQLEVGPTTHPVKVTASALVTNRTVVIGDQSGRIHGLDVDTGQVKWTTQPNPHPFAAVWGSGTMVGKYVAIGISSNEWFIPFFDPSYQTSFRGSLVLLDPANGDVIWQTFTISEQENAAGASGAPIWSSPTYDRATNTIYATTGNNYSQPTTGTSDAFMAFDAATGAVKWINQRTAGDEWNLAFGDSSPDHPDFDIGDSPQVYKLGGRTVVSAGQKSGFFHVLDAATGEEVNDPIQLAPAGTVGGLFADSAYANGVVYANGTDWPAPIFGTDPPNRGVLSAVAADGSRELWHFDTRVSPNISGVAVANGVVYFQSMLDGTFYALDAVSGLPLAQVATGGQSSGPAVSRGQIYLGTGDTAFPFLDPTLPIGPGSITALGLPDAPSRPMTGNGSGTLNPFSGAFTATGNATHLGAFTHYGTILLTPTADPNIFLISGRTTYEAANGDQLYAILSGTLNLATGVATGTDIWDGGTGRFANASGTVDLTAQLLEGGAFTFDLVGNISY